MKQIVYILIGVSLAFGGVVYAEKLERLTKPNVAPEGKVAVKDTATSTEYAPRFAPFDFLPEYSGQSTCIRIAASDTGGVLYITGTSAGLAISTSSCGQ